MPKKILIVSDKDWANMGYIFAECLRLNKYKVDSFNLRHTKIIYKQRSKLINKKDLFKILDNYNFIIIMHSGQGIVWSPGKNGKMIIDQIMINKLKNIKKGNAKIIVFHGGSAYRRRYNKINQIFNKISDLTLIQTPDLFGLGAKKEVLTFSPFKENNLSPNFSINSPLIIGHYPTNPAKKNSGMIINKIREIGREEPGKFIFKYSKKLLPYEDNLNRIRECDIYIEDQMYVMNGRKYSIFGLTAMEAANLGCIVISCNGYAQQYSRIFGSCELIISNNEVAFINAIKHLINLDKRTLKNLKRKSWEWSQKHSYISFGKTFGNILSSI